MINKINTLVREQTKRQVEIMTFAESLKRLGKLKTGYDVVNNITKHGLTNGYNNAVNKLLTPFMKDFVKNKF